MLDVTSSPLLPMLLLGVILVAFGAGLAFTPASALITDRATGAGLNQGYAAGSANVAWGGGQMVGAVGAGYLAGVAGYALPAVVMVVLLGVVWVLVRPVTEPGGASRSAMTPPERLSRRRRRPHPTIYGGVPSWLTT